MRLPQTVDPACGPGAPAAGAFFVAPLAVAPPRSACERLRLPAARGRRERIAAPTETAALIAALRPDDRALWGCAFYAGLRRGELRGLDWPTAVRKRALTAWRRAGLDPIGFHECRHTFASLLIAAEVNAKAITAYLGHASIQTTFDLYGHLMPGNEDEAIALVDAYLDRVNTDLRIVQID